MEKLKTKRYTSADVSAVIARSVVLGINRAYKHRDEERPSEAIVESIAAATAMYAIDSLDAMIEFEEPL